MATPIVSVSVDLDEVSCYFQIHGLSEPESPSRALWTHAVPRLLELFDGLGVRATFFAVGESLDVAVGTPGAQKIVAAGHELANHSLGHRYDLLRLDVAAQRREIDGGADAIEAATGRRPVGFRAPGYNVDDELLALLVDAGYEYDSSVFPCPPYYGAKAAAMATMRLRGRTSRSILGPPQVLLAPAEPYVVDRSFWRRGRGEGLVELPVAVLPGTRVPYIGTTVTLAGDHGARALGALVSARRYVGFELHGMDALDSDDPGLAPLQEHQPDTRVAVETKLRRLNDSICALRHRGARFRTCAEAASLVRAHRVS